MKLTRSSWLCVCFDIFVCLCFFVCMSVYLYASTLWLVYIKDIFKACRIYISGHVPVQEIYKLRQRHRPQLPGVCEKAGERGWVGGEWWCTWWHPPYLPFLYCSPNIRCPGSPTAARLPEHCGNLFQAISHSFSRLNRWIWTNSKGITN